VGRLNVEKLHVTFTSGTGPDGPATPRAYTLTHSDVTGDLFLNIGPKHNKSQISGLYTRLMRDEVLAEWSDDGQRLALRVHCHVSGGMALGPPKMRLAIFKREMPLVLEAFRYGDRRLFEVRPTMDQAPVLVHFHARQPRYDRVESWGVPADYRHQHR
jgi:hypothetical protein